MVDQTKHSRSGLFEWLVQRSTAVIVGVYAIFLMVYLLDHVAANYSSWHALYANSWMRIFTVIVVLSVIWHAWIGLWTVFTDYVKSKMLRLILEVIVILLLLGYLIWVLDILWR